MWKARADFDAWTTKNYKKLLSYAKRYHIDYNDLVHHVYLRIIKAAPENIMNNPMGYWHRSLYFEAKRGKFKKEYTYRDLEYKDEIEQNNLEDLIRKENVLILCDRLHWFDRVIFELYIDGWNMAEIARETKIPRATLLVSIHRSKNKIKDATSNRKN